MTETIWPPKLKRCVSLYKKSLQILNFEEMLLVAAKAQKLRPLTNLCVYHIYQITGAIFSISREQSDSVKSNQHSYLTESLFPPPIQSSITSQEPSSTNRLYIQYQY